MPSCQYPNMEIKRTDDCLVLSPKWDFLYRCGDIVTWSQGPGSNHYRHLLITFNSNYHIRSVSYKQKMLFNRIVSLSDTQHWRHTSFNAPLLTSYPMQEMYRWPVSAGFPTSGKCFHHMTSSWGCYKISFMKYSLMNTFGVWLRSPCLSAGNQCALFPHISRSLCNREWVVMS